MDVKLKAEAAESAFKLNQELEEKTEHLKFRLQSVVQALAAEEVKNKAMQDMLNALNEIKTTEKDKQSIEANEEKLRKIDEAVQAERSMLKKQLEDLELRLKVSKLSALLNPLEPSRRVHNSSKTCK